MWRLRGFCKRGKPKRKGYISIETVFATSFFLIFFLLVIGFFTYIHPKTILQQDVIALSQLAQRQGGLTLEDVENFQARIASYPFVDASEEDIVVTATTLSGNFDAIGVDGLDEAGDNYVKRDSKEFIQLTVIVPSNHSLLSSVANFFGADGVLSEYAFQTTFMSERY